MANLPQYKDGDFTNPVDFDLKRVFDMPTTEVSVWLPDSTAANDFLLRQLRQVPQTDHSLWR